MAESSLKKMAGRIPESAIEEIRTRADIVEVVSEYVSLKSSGKNHKGLCPFHQEKTPSFSVSSEKQIFYCFGCSAGGNVFKFLMEIESITFIDAVKKLGNRFHVPIPEQSLSPKEEKNRNDREIILNLNKFATEYYSHHLRKTEGGGLAREYIKSRGFDKNTAEEFQLGWATPEWGGLLAHLKKMSSTSEKLIEKAGLITIKPATGGKRESQYDRFRNRLIFPLMDVFGNIIGFAGRIISEGEPKYLNSPETPLYTKGDHLFGLNKAKEAIRKENRVLLVEGYFDQICSFQNGIKNTVALCGTALTLNQVALLRKYTTNIVLVFDSDSAGQAAAQRGFELLLSEGLNISVVLLPQGYDPDSYIREKGKDGFLELVNNAKPFLESLIDRTILEGTKNATGKTATVNKILPAISKIKSSVERSEYIRYLSEKAHVDQKSLLEDLGKFFSGKKRNEKESKVMSEKRPVLELFLIHLILSDEEAAKEIKNQLSPDEYHDELYREIAKNLYSRIQENQPLRLDLILEQTDNPEIKSVLSEFGVAPTTFDAIPKATADCIRKIKKRNRNPKIIELRKQRNEADEAGLRERSRELHNQTKEFST
ncbi:MAG: DNA primase [Nitrospinales bacterium]